MVAVPSTPHSRPTNRCPTLHSRQPSPPPEPGYYVYPPLEPRYYVSEPRHDVSEPRHYTPTVRQHAILCPANDDELMMLVMILYPKPYDDDTMMMMILCPKPYLYVTK